jgi:integrase/recombinase XerD
MLIITGMRTAEAIESYLEELRDRGMSTHTVRAYRGDLNAFAAVAPEFGTSRDGGVVAGYAESLDALPPATRRRRLSALTGFVSWAASRGITSANVQRTRPVKPRAAESAESATSARAVPAQLAADIAAVLTQIPRQADRDQLLFGLMARLGLRPGEALGLRIEDVDTERELLTVRGWGGRIRSIVIDDSEVLLRLRNGLRVIADRTGPVFPSPAGSGTLRYQSMAERWAGYAARAGVSVTPGDLRRAHCAELLAGGVPEWVVRQRLGQATGDLPGTGGTAASAEAAIREWRHSREIAHPSDGRRAARDTRSGGAGEAGSETADGSRNSGIA